MRLTLMKFAPALVRDALAAAVRISAAASDADK
jgi:hypothetical protein